MTTETILPAAPAHLWRHFYRFTQTPRPSKHEQAICDYIIREAEACGCRYQRDSFGNLVIRVPGSPGLETRPSLIIQNHVDMVTVKADDKEHDFFCDPLTLQIEDDWLLADRTTLGADNGVGCAAALALMTDPEVQHPPLELLFTLDEETGLGGALNLDGSLLSGRRMLNLDTEDWGELYIGCAGGRDWHLQRDLQGEETPAGMTGLQLSLSGLAGGHSGIQIHQQLGNAIKLLAQWLYRAEALGVRLCSFEGGSAHNVIPRSAHLLVGCPPGSVAALEQLSEALRQEWLNWLPAADNGLQLQLTPCDAPATVLDLAGQRLVRQCLLALPHGAQAYNEQHPADLVDLSINLAVVRVSAQALFVETSLRYFNADQAKALAESLLSTADTFGLSATEAISYPGWQPDFDSELLALARTLYRDNFGEEPATKAIHAGLECGILLDKLPGTQAVSFGPTIRGAHSPRERLQISTIQPFWDYLCKLVASL
ncbi:beta-Ala-His dipeptidase [Pseudomaricurvus sp. HS19]|uniref:beta-Ala-His dipeptidase n=1 Tax=Pseudomaricurvus sp. HS19 TaxID=2692626 RepID=UPI00136E9499|nr:beta-Ala-His dipeptidase [Pseudomaricurvus sp. HS19]MYM62715.1 beta-Ala-His dipeptidase [Pseudomaricurvus sp. HS19]